MNYLEQQHQNKFLFKWMYGKLTTKEYNAFVSSRLYENLVYSTVNKRNSKIEKP